MNKCVVCKGLFPDSETYEYRGNLSCENHFDQMVEARDFQRREIISEECTKTEIFKHVSIDPSCPIGRANLDILKHRIEICSKESGRLKSYEGRN